LIAAPAHRRSVGLRWPDLSHHSLNVWRRNRDVYLRLWRSELVLPLIEPLLVLFGLGLGLGHFINLQGETSNIRYLAPGVLAQSGMFQATFECSWTAYFRMDSQGTYLAIAATPASLDDIVFGELLWGATRSLINSTYMLALCLVLTPHYDIVRSPEAILALPLSYLLGFCFASLALAFTAMAPSMSFLGYFFNLVIIPIFWLSGGFFPLEQLPGALQSVAWALPLTPVISTYRHLLDGTAGWTDVAHVALVAAESVLLCMLAAALVRRRLIK
jgi:lipooligosaccharide transport system permease protein